MAVDDGLQTVPFNIGPAQTQRVKQHFPNVSSESIAVPGSEMENLVPSEEQPLELEGGNGMIYLGHPLRHSHVIRILRLKLEFEDTAVGHPRKAPQLSPHSAVSSNAKEFPIPVSNQSETILVTGKSGLWRLKYGAHQVVVQKGSPQGELSLFERMYPEVVPWALLENGKRNGVPLH